MAAKKLAAKPPGSREQSADVSVSDSDFLISLTFALLVEGIRRATRRETGNEWQVIASVVTVLLIGITKFGIDPAIN